ncbi:MAG: hypothetical protein ACRDDH_03975 [Cetobacterium sp.]|uniref:hypothetical protein n=1 Tax=Cetobacterium sp. TaxID=2071632 RepID=UPI003EE4B22F
MRVPVGNKLYTTRTNVKRPRVFVRKNGVTEYLELTTDKSLTNPGNKFYVILNGVRHYVRELFNKTETITICAQTPNPRNSSRVYRVDNYIIPARAVNLSKLKIDVRVTSQGSHRNDGPGANGHVVLEAFESGNKVFSQTIWSDQTNGGDGASGFEAGQVFNRNISTILSDNSTNIYDLQVKIYLTTGDYQAHVDGGRHRYQRVHGICVTVYD